MSASLETTSRPKRGDLLSSVASAATNPAAQTKSKKKITNANTDRLCLDDNSTFLGRLWYHLSLHNGLYLLDPTEKAAFNTIGALFTVLTILYLWSFGRGFVDGLGSASSSMVGQQPLQQQGAVGVILDPTGRGGIRSDERLSATLGDAAANGKSGSVDPSSVLASSSSATGGASSEL